MGRLRVEETNQLVVCAIPYSANGFEALIDQPLPLRLNVRYIVGNVVDPFSALRDVLADRTIVIRAFEQFDLGFTNLKKGGGNALRLDPLFFVGRFSVKLGVGLVRIL